MKKKYVFSDDDDIPVIFTGVYYLEEELSLIGFFSSTFSTVEKAVIENDFISVYTVKNRYGYFLKLVAEKRTDVPPFYYRLKVQNPRYHAFCKEIEKIEDIAKIVTVYDIALQSSASNDEVNIENGQFAIVNKHEIINNEVFYQN